MPPKGIAFRRVVLSRSNGSSQTSFSLFACLALLASWLALRFSVLICYLMFFLCYFMSFLCDMRCDVCLMCVSPLCDARRCCVYGWLIRAYVAIARRAFYARWVFAQCCVGDCLTRVPCAFDARFRVRCLRDAVSMLVSMRARRLRDTCSMHARCVLEACSVFGACLTIILCRSVFYHCSRGGSMASAP